MAGMKHFVSVLLMLLALSLPASAADDVLPVARDFLRAVYVTRSLPALQKVIVDPAAAAQLLHDVKVSPESSARLKQAVQQLRAASEPRYYWQGLDTDAAHATRPGSRCMIDLDFSGSLVVLPMVRQSDGWKVDERFVLAATSEPKEDSPEMTARKFLFVLFQKDEKALTELITEPQMDVLNEGNDFPGGDLDQLLSLAQEMAVTRAREGELVRTPSGTLLTVHNTEDHVVVLGLYGAIVLPFEMVLRDGHWRVVPQPYVAMMRARGFI